MPLFLAQELDPVRGQVVEAADDLMTPDPSSSAMTALPFWSRPLVSSNLLRATASANSGLSGVRFPGKVVWEIAGGS